MAVALLEHAEDCSAQAVTWNLLVLKKIFIRVIAAALQ